MRLINFTQNFSSVLKLSFPPCVGRSSILEFTATSWVHYTTSCNTQSSAPEDGRDHRPKHIELIGIIIKPLLLHLVGCLYHLHQRGTVKQISNIFTSFSYSMCKVNFLFPSFSFKLN